MKPDEFKKFDDEKPLPNKWIIVTNNIDAKNVHNEMTHVWLTSFWTEDENKDYRIITFSSGAKVLDLTHWKYA